MSNYVVVVGRYISDNESTDEYIEIIYREDGMKFGVLKYIDIEHGDNYEICPNMGECTYVVVWHNGTDFPFPKEMIE